MTNRWEDVEDLLVRAGQRDIEERGYVEPAMAAFAGDHLRFVAWLRPHEKGRYHDPMIELLALAMPLDADRLAVSSSARVWSLEDPIPPVTEDADLRQRALIVHLVDGARGRPRCRSALHPFDVVDGRVVWQGRVEEAGAQGWIPQAMEISVRDRRKLATDEREIRKQARRVDALGHTLYLPPDMLARLASTGRPAGGRAHAPAHRLAGRR